MLLSTKGIFMKKTLFVCLLLAGATQASLQAKSELSDERMIPKQRDSKMIGIGLSGEKRTKAVQQLQKLLANVYVLYVKTQKYHWNVEGKHFHDLHKMFGEQYEQLASYTDMIAERIRALGVEAIGTVSEFYEYTTLTEHPGQNPGEQSMISDLLEDYETIIKQIRADIDMTAEINDMGTNNFLSDLIMKLEKTAWMLRVSIEK